MVSNVLPLNASPPFHLLAKPSGSTCNIDCTYRFFLFQEALYPNEKYRMSDATPEAYTTQLLESHYSPAVTVAWQEGEPTLVKVEFFQRSMEFVAKDRKLGQAVQHTCQTNGMRHTMKNSSRCALKLGTGHRRSTTPLHEPGRRAFRRGNVSSDSQ
jgi:sulfatase maturation enzyme AslB (radical SAM superfamily)